MFRNKYGAMVTYMSERGFLIRKIPGPQVKWSAPVFVTGSCMGAGFSGGEHAWVVGMAWCGKGILGGGAPAEGRRPSAQFPRVERGIRLGEDPRCFAPPGAAPPTREAALPPFTGYTKARTCLALANGQAVDSFLKGKSEFGPAVHFLLDMNGSRIKRASFDSSEHQDMTKVERDKFGGVTARYFQVEAAMIDVSIQGESAAGK